MTVDPQAQAFARVADAYERGRPTYVPAAVEWAAGRLGLDEDSRVLDLAAGTGKLTELLADRFGDVVAVEPLDEMRRVLEAEAARRDGAGRHGAGDSPARRRGTGGLHRLGVPLVRDADALAEIHRVLAPGGGLVLLWNRPDRSAPRQPWQDELTEVTDRLAWPEAPGTRLGRSGGWKNVLDESPLFGPAEEASFPFEHRLTRDQLVDQLASRSWLAAFPPDAFERALADIRRAAGGTRRRQRRRCRIAPRCTARSPLRSRYSARQMSTTVAHDVRDLGWQQTAFAGSSGQTGRCRCWR